MLKGTKSTMRILALLILAVAVFPAPVEATADPLIITTSTTLMADHSGNIIIGANNITLDCAGFSVIGSGSGSGDGILLDGKTGVTVENCRVTGFENGFHLFSSNNNTFGENTATGNRFGFKLDNASDNLFEGNTSNNNDGTDFGFSDGYGFFIEDSSGNTFEGNTANGNLSEGFNLGNNSSGNTLDENTASGNDNAGFSLVSSSGNTLRNNTASSNVNNGFDLTASSGNLLEKNIISGNDGNGVVIADAATANHVRGNSIFANAGLGIDLGPDGVTPNDLGDADTGANNLQNFPVLTSVTGGSTNIDGTLNSTANTTFRLEFFSNTTCDPSGHGEGETFLDSTMVTTNGSGNANFMVTSPTTVPVGQFITATATDADNNTSEFSECALVPVTFADVPMSHWAWQFVEAIYSAGLTSGFPDGTYRPDNPVTRAEMAVFIKKGIHGSTYTPPTLDGSHPFSDIAGHWAEAWIEDLFDEGFTSGFPDGTYRPDNQVTRAEMAVFLKKAIHGSAYTSPTPDGSHPFSDIASHWAEAWIEDLFDEGITSGFPDGTYRPENTATRAEMAVFLVNAFSLPLP